ncbi:MAG TPA: hypothetical protein ENN32_05400 [Chloroflexi bacterium]|nr:hypothetical protein [Chloroflexota bacterium]
MEDSCQTPTSNNKTSHSTSRTTLIAFLIITVTWLLIYGPILFDSNSIPWGSDTLGHVFRFEYLRESLQQGIWLPDFVPEWYLGIQLFRYYPPFVYYPLAVASLFIKDPILVTSLFIALCAWLGGLSWLLFQRMVGWIPSILGGILFMLLPDLVRVAFAEGNLLRQFANMLLPLLFFLLQTVITKPEKRWAQIALAFTFTALVLSHPMMASITAVMAIVFISLVTLLKNLKIIYWFRTVTIMVMGILIASFWLLPSLTGGITDLSKEAMVEGLPVVSLVSLLSPATRLHNKEALYVGFSLLLLPLVMVFIPRVRKNHDFWALSITGLLGWLLVTPVLNSLFYALPLAELMWPARFLTIASAFLLAATIYGVHLAGQNLPGNYKRYLLLSLLILPLLIDFNGSRRLIHHRPNTGEISLIADTLTQNQGWRQATLDHSRTASAPSYFIYANANREQLFGWGFQGARTAGLVAGINEAMLRGHTDFAIDRLNLASVDDIWVANTIPQPYLLHEKLVNTGFQLKETNTLFDLYHREGSPRAIISSWETIAIGNTAQNYAYLFPQIITSDSPYLDEYTLEELSRYKTVILAGFSWHNRANAESLVIDLAQSGCHVVIDLTRSRQNPLSQQLNFLDIWGERVILDYTPMTAVSEYSSYVLAPFRVDDQFWYTITPQNLDEEVLTAQFLNQPLVLTGYKQVGDSKVWFVGLNLAYHAVLNNDPSAALILADLLGFSTGETSDYKSIPLMNYYRDGKQVSFTLALDTSQTVLLPFANFDGTVVHANGEKLETRPISNLIQIQAPAGEKQYTISFEKPGIYSVGAAISLISLPTLFLFIFFGRENDN